MADPIAELLKQLAYYKAGGARIDQPTDLDKVNSIIANASKGFVDPILERRKKEDDSLSALVRQRYSDNPEALPAEGWLQSFLNPRSMPSNRTVTNSADTPVQGPQDESGSPVKSIIPIDYGPQMTLVNKNDGRKVGTMPGKKGNILEVGSSNTGLTPKQVEAIRSKDIKKLNEAFPEGVPLGVMNTLGSFTRGDNSDLNSDENRKIRLTKLALDYGNQVESLPVMKLLNNQDFFGSQVDAIIDLAESGNTVSTSALGAKVAKQMGETGNLSKQDVTRYIESKKLPQRIGDKLTLWFDGTPTKTTVEEISEMSQALKGIYEEKIAVEQNKIVERFARANNISNEDSSYLLSRPYTPLKKSTRKDRPKEDAALPEAKTDAPAPAPAPGVPKVGDIRKGYRFKGGDPADKNSWEAQ